MIRAWVRLMWNSGTVAAVTVAAQLGVGDVLSIIRWDGGDGADATRWSALLTWIAFSYAVAVLAGALVGRRAVSRSGNSGGLGVATAATLSAAIGSVAAVPLAWLPAQDAVAPARVHPALVVAITAGAGALVGIVVALVALSAPPVAAGLRATVTWLWLAAIGCAAAGVASHQPYPAPRLGVLDAPSLVPATWWTGPRLMVGVAVVIALVIAGVARWGGAGRFGVALAGLGGPAIVVAAYLIAGPGSGADRSAQFEPYLAALLAAGAGLVTSVLVAMPGRRGGRPVPQPTETSDSTPLTGDLIPAEAAPSGSASVGGSASPVSPAGANVSSSGFPWRSSGHGRFDVLEGPPAPPAGSWGQRTGAGPADHPTGEQPILPPLGEPQRGRVGSTYTGGVYGGASAPVGPTAARTRADDKPSPLPAPMMGQPAGGDDPHESWLREIGSPGRHSLD